MTTPTSHFKLLMISAEMEHFGNGLHRHFSDHPNCFTYPFESQLGTKFSRNVMIPSIHPVRYAYPEFPEGTTFDRALTLIWDEELKAYLRNPQRSKFRDCSLVMSETARRASFLKHCEGKPFSRAAVVEAYFRSCFDTWENLNRSGRETTFVGYNPGMVADSDKLLSDFPTAHIIHVVRNPWSAYADYLKRPFPQQSLEEYALAYNVGHGLAYNLVHKHPDRFHVIRLEDFLADKRGALGPILAKVGLPWDDALLKPSFNGRDLSDHLPPWGTVEKPTTAYNLAQARSLSVEDKDRLAAECALIIHAYGYSDLGQEIRA